MRCFVYSTFMLLALAAMPLTAATINVDTTDDVVSPDGFCSLREAIDSANDNLAPGAAGECEAGEASPTVDLISLPAGTYVLDLGSPGDDGNNQGDLDVLDSVDILGDGAGSTEIVSGYGFALVRGDGDRIFDVDPEGAIGEVDFRIRGVAILGGDISCTGFECRPRAAAINQGAPGTSSSTEAGSRTTTSPVSVTIVAATRRTRGTRRGVRQPSGSPEAEI